MSLEAVPVVHVENGQLLELPDDDVEASLTDLARRFERVAIVDVEGIRRNTADLTFLQAAGRRRSIWVDAGSRYANDAMDLFIAGAESVTLRWNTLHNAAELEEAASLCQPETLFLCLEFPGGKFLEHRKDPRPASAVVRLAESLGVGIVYVTDTADASFVRSLPPANVPRWLMGPTKGLRDDLQSWGFHGVLARLDELPEAKTP